VALRAVDRRPAQEVQRLVGLDALGDRWPAEPARA
jgi:hypothetical protein